MYLKEEMGPKSCHFSELTHLGLDVTGKTQKVHILKGNGKMDSMYM